MRFDYALHFRHVRATDDSCETCHHTDYDGDARQFVHEPGAEEGCRSCHGAEGLRGKTARVPLGPASHALCITCHQEGVAEGKKTGPTLCAGCHDAANQQALPSLEPAEIGRLERDQPDVLWLLASGAKSGAVPFDHQAHELRTTFCSSCHHESLEPCQECHTIGGSERGQMVTLEQAYHLATSERSCVGCHQKRVRDKACAGCHHVIDEASSEHACRHCHGGPSADALAQFGQTASSRPISLAELPAESEDFPETVVIDVLARDYEASTLPHRQIVAALDKAVRSDGLATHFHGATETLCSGCHHHSPADTRPPPCRSCHAYGADQALDRPLARVALDEGGADKPALLQAYHRQCLVCHQQMSVDKQGCTDCHAKTSEADSNREGNP